MRELAVRTTIEECTASQFYTTCLAEPHTTQRMHKSLSADVRRVGMGMLTRMHTNRQDMAEVSPWCSTEDKREGTRVVQFCLQVNIPQWLLSMVGADMIKVTGATGGAHTRTRKQVREEQTLMWSDDRSQLTVISEPHVLGVPLSSSTTTRIVLAVTTAPNGKV